METLKHKILEIIKEAKKIDKRKKVDEHMKFLDGYEKETHHTNPRKLSLDNIKATTETAYQREIFRSVKAKLDTIGEVLWVDMELPVVFNKKPRRKSVDLIGTLNGNTPVLCELKFGSEKSTSDSPVYAAIELLIYYYLIQMNNEELDEQNVFHPEKRKPDFKWKHFNHTSVFIIGANDTYWNYWINRYKKQKYDIELWQRLLAPFKIQFFSSGSFGIEKQEELQDESKPNIREWHEIYL